MHSSKGNADAPSLDPADWPQFRQIAHRLLDNCLDRLQGVADGPVWRPVPESVAAELASPIPRLGLGTEGTARAAERLIAPYPTGNTHPRFFGWVHGSGTAGGMLAEMLAAQLNANVGGREHGAVHVERTVIGWFRDLFGLPEAAGGLLVSGTSMATVVALAAARNRLAGADVRKLGIAAAPRPLVAYASSEAHGSAAKALELLGLGRDALRLVPVDTGFRMRPDALAAMITADRTAGRAPFAVIATAGTVNTGATDPIGEIASISSREGLWLHVDGAFGGLQILAPELAANVSGIEQADSIAFDFHKWLHVPYDAGCVLVRDRQALFDTFASRPVYLSGGEALAGGEPWFCDLGPELSRGFRALKVWWTLTEHGLDRLGQKIADNCALARQLATRIEPESGLELLAPVALNIVCFRALAPGLDPAPLDRLNAHIVTELQLRGIAAPSTTRIAGRLAIRVNITNHRTQPADIDLLVDAVLALAKELRP